MRQHTTKLSESEKLSLELRQKGLSYSQIAKLMNCTIPSLNIKLHLARLKRAAQKKTQTLKLSPKEERLLQANQRGTHTIKDLADELGVSVDRIKWIVRCLRLKGYKVNITKKRH